MLDPPTTRLMRHLEEQDREQSKQSQGRRPNSDARSIRRGTSGGDSGLDGGTIRGDTSGLAVGVAVGVVARVVVIVDVRGGLLGGLFAGDDRDGRRRRSGVGSGAGLGIGVAAASTAELRAATAASGGQSVQRVRQPRTARSLDGRALATADRSPESVGIALTERLEAAEALEGSLASGQRSSAAAQQRVVAARSLRVSLAGRAVGKVGRSRGQVAGAERSTGGQRARGHAVSSTSGGTDAVDRLLLNSALSGGRGNRGDPDVEDGGSRVLGSSGGDLDGALAKVAGLGLAPAVVDVAVVHSKAVAGRVGNFDQQTGSVVEVQVDDDRLRSSRGRDSGNRVVVAVSSLQDSSRGSGGQRSEGSEGLDSVEQTGPRGLDRIVRRDAGSVDLARSSGKVYEAAVVFVVVIVDEDLRVQVDVGTREARGNQAVVRRSSAVDLQESLVLVGAGSVDVADGDVDESVGSGGDGVVLELGRGGHSVALDGSSEPLSGQGGAGQGSVAGHRVDLQSVTSALELAERGHDSNDDARASVAAVISEDRASSKGQVPILTSVQRILITGSEELNVTGGTQQIEGESEEGVVGGHGDAVVVDRDGVSSADGSGSGLVDSQGNDVLEGDGQGRSRSGDSLAVRVRLGGDTTDNVVRLGSGAIARAD